MIKRKQSYYHIAWLFVMIMTAACNLVQDDTATIPTPNIPQAEFLSPENNRQVVEGTDIWVEIVARDSDTGIARIEFYVDESLINSATPLEAERVPIFTARLNWRAQGVGLHVFEAIAYRLDGTQSDSAVITIEVLSRDQ